MATRELSKEQLEQILKAHAEWLATSGEKGARADLCDMDLREANLQRVNLRKAKIQRADLCEACFWWADLREAYLREANLWRASLWQADLREADLREANLGRASLWQANLWRSRLGGANLWQADLREADLREAGLDFSCWPLSCGGLRAKVSDRTAAQLLYHAVHQDFSACSGGVQEAMEVIRKMAVSELFTEYRDY